MGSSRLEIQGNDFVLQGQKHRILSGSVSYFRMLPEQWRDRLEKLLALGCNCVEVYVPWNLHEASEGDFDFQGRKDLYGFLKLCEELELDVLLRPGPYICAEWDLGGLPWWLLKGPDPRPLRSSDKDFLMAVGRWWGELLPKLRRFLAVNGGPIIAIQIENEYGYWGIDKAYLQELRDLVSTHLPDCLLFTSDGTFWPDLQQNGGLEDVLRTANFGSDARQRLQELRAAQREGPLCNMEFWVGAARGARSSPGRLVRRLGRLDGQELPRPRGCGADAARHAGGGGVGELLRLPWRHLLWLLWAWWQPVECGALRASSDVLRLRRPA